MLISINISTCMIKLYSKVQTNANRVHLQLRACNIKYTNCLIVNKFGKCFISCVSFTSHHRCASNYSRNIIERSKKQSKNYKNSKTQHHGDSKCFESIFDIQESSSASNVFFLHGNLITSKEMFFKSVE
jgi:hypothetical protein